MTRPISRRLTARDYRAALAVGIFVPLAVAAATTSAAWALVALIQWVRS